MSSSAVAMPALFWTRRVIETRTLVSAQLNVSKQADLNDLPQKAQNQMRFAFPKVQSSDVDHVTANGRGRVKRQVKILLQYRNNDLH